MKKAIMAAAILAMLGSTATQALAQDGPRGDRDERRGARQGGDSGYNPAVRRSWRNNPDTPPPAAAAPQAQAPQAAPQARGDRDWRRGGRDDRDRDGRAWSDRRAWSDGRRFERPRYDRRAYAPFYRADRRYHGPRYRAPSGFYVRSWNYGSILPHGWYGRDYWLNDWYDYGLPIPPVGYEWVRVGADVLLVDTFSGRVVQVVRNLFW